MAAGAPLGGVGCGRGGVLLGLNVVDALLPPLTTSRLLVLVLVLVVLVVLLVLVVRPGDPVPLDLLDPLGQLGALRHQLGELVPVHLHLGFPDTRGRTLLRPVRLLVSLRVGLVDGACSVVMVEASLPPITHKTALRVSSYELPKGQRRVANAARVPLLLLPPTLLQGLPVSRFAPRAQVPGHEGTNGHFGGLIVVVIVDESLIAAGSRWVHGSFPARSSPT